jgi:type I restriction enzyme M protein
MPRLALLGGDDAGRRARELRMATAKSGSRERLAIAWAEAELGSWDDDLDGLIWSAWMEQFKTTIDFLWEIANLLRDDFKRGKYQDVILPFTVLRRLDQVLAPTREAVLKENAKLERLGIREEQRDPMLREVSRHAFYNVSRFNFERLVVEHTALEANLAEYLAGYSKNVRDLLEKFNFENTLEKLIEAELLFKVVEEFKNADLHPSTVPNHGMGYIFEELIRRFNEALDENPGEHFTPREVGALMTELLVAHDPDALKQEYLIRTVCDPCCGTGGLLQIAKQRLKKINKQIDVFVFGQEVNPETWAIAVADFLVGSEDGRDAKNIKFGSVLSNEDKDLTEQRFHYQLANPPYGKKWKKDEEKVKAEHRLGEAGRFGAGIPKVTDGQFLFIQHMLNRMKDPDEGGGRVAIISNGSPLFSGDAGGAESEIRRWILENDWLDAVVGLPEDLFYNTGIKTYVWILTNKKPKNRVGKVQLIDATGREFWEPLSKSLGKKRRKLTDTHIAKIREIYEAHKEGPYSQIHPVEAFGYRKITIDLPLKRSFEVTDERESMLRTDKAFVSLAVKYEGEEDPQDALLAALDTLRGKFWNDQTAFLPELETALTAKGVEVTAPLKKAILANIGQPDPDAVAATDEKGKRLYDPELRNSERVPLGEDVEEFFKLEVKPFVEEAVLVKSIKDAKDKGIGKKGFEINFNRFFFKYSLPRPLDEVETDLANLEEEIAALVEEVTA